MRKSLAEARTPGDSARAADATIASTWRAAGRRPADERLLDWPPDVFAFTDAILDRAEAYRFVIAPPPGRAWPPAEGPEWRKRVCAAARCWSAWTECGVASPPELVVEEWLVVRGTLDTPLADIASGRPWRVCEALLTLHAIADEACAAVATAANGRDGEIIMRARSAELLARTGSIARIDPSLLRVVPKYRTPAGGIKPRSISRYISRTGPAANPSVGEVGVPATVPSRAVVRRSCRSALSPADLTVLVSWSEAVAQARATSPLAVPTVLANAQVGASWRSEFGVPQPAGALSDALDAFARDHPAGS